MNQRAKSIFIAVLLLLVASCSGGGCSSGCAACGTTPLPGGFPKSDTIPNAAQVRVTRPGLDFVQENLGTLATSALGTANGGVIAFPIPKSSASGATICPNANPKPPECQADIGIGDAKLRLNAVAPDQVQVDGTLPVRISNLPISLIGIGLYVVVGDKTKAPGQDLCNSTIKGKDAFPYKDFPLTVKLPLVTETRVPRDGFTKVDVPNATIDIGITQDDLAFCGAGFIGDIVKAFAFNTLVTSIEDQVRSTLANSFCTTAAVGVAPPCPAGTEVNGTQCVYSTEPKTCLPSLLGADGRMSLGQALASFSPGTQGTLDFVLASAGPMNPAPGDTTVPTWIPRKPPVPAEDDNHNGISLSMLGGVIPQPTSGCIVPVANPVPTGIPVPAELTADTIPNWPAGTVGPHLGVAFAGRFLDHAMASAFNSGALCLGLSTDQVAQLSSGYLGILAPSIKNLTFEAQPTAAAITTRPGLPPKIKLGTDPLMTVQIDQFAVDFYVFSYDRFVRMFTFTADLTVPVNLQTGKSDKNPNGGLLPVIGNIGLANSKVTNSELLVEDPALISSGISGLLGGLVSQFLNLSPIDLNSSLAGFGLGLDIPTGGIRKLTSGSDDFLGLFANLTKATTAAKEEADTRAEIVAKTVHPDDMGLSARRDRFPTLTVHVEGIASKKTEHTWWVDDGPHAAWTTANDVVVDRDTMILQGHHVLHVSARVVGDMASEDSSPVAIPFTIDSLAPSIDARREGDRVIVRAKDYVSEALEARHRLAGGAFSEWSAVADFEATTDVDIEVRDEEGNIGRVSLPLVRGRADSTITAAGSGCGCRTTPSSSNFGPLAILGLCGTILARRRTRRDI